MNKVIHPCNVPEYDGKKHPLYAKIEFKDGKLSISGVIGPKHGGNAVGSCGQIDMGFDHKSPGHNDKRYSAPIKASALTFAPGWNMSMWYKFLNVWQRWHLNDMKAGCEHMTGPEWDTSKELTLTPLRPGDQYHKTRKAAEDGKLSPREYKQWQKDVSESDSAWLHSKPSHDSLWNKTTKELIKRGYLKIDKIETKNSGWVYPSEHPGGLLTKPCPTCGHKYGSAWRKEEVPADVIAFLESLPDTDTKPAWV